ncbi:MAG: hypothetical protein INF91_04765, partial [Alphaproteobacteria bacterium]|nr:hypothetical protein [Alphaproteobacteria bacterium]
MPPLGTLGDLQPTNVATPFPRLSAKVPGAGRGSLDASVRAPLAIRLPAGREHSASALMPHAPDNDRPLFRTAPTLKNGQWPRVTAIIAGTGRVAPLARLLPSLANQTVFDSLDVIVALAVGQKAKTEQIQKVLAPLFGKSGKVVTPGQDRPSARLNAAARRAKGEYLFVLDEAMLLHDPRTIEALLTLAMQPGVASAGCMQLREVAASSDQFTSLPGGFFPARIAFGGAPSLIFDEPKTSGPLTRATFPVAANSLRATLVPAAVWRSAGGLDDETFPIAGYDLEFGLRTLKQGLGHLVK